MEILILQNGSAIARHGVGFQAVYAIAKLRVENNSHADYFIRNYKGQHNYKEAFPVQEEVVFDVELEGMNGNFWDRQVKPANWEPFK